MAKSRIPAVLKRTECRYVASWQTHRRGERSVGGIWKSRQSSIG